MKLGELAAGAFIVFGGIVAACSSKAPVQPPVAPGSDTPLGGGGSGPPAASEDAGDGSAATFPSEDAASDAANPCLSLTCLGCCTPTNECLAGNLNTACGFDNARCTTCSGTQTCISGSGCE